MAIPNINGLGMKRRCPSFGRHDLWYRYTKRGANWFVRNFCDDSVRSTAYAEEYQDGSREEDGIDIWFGIDVWYHMKQELSCFVMWHYRIAGSNQRWWLQASFSMWIVITSARNWQKLSISWSAFIWNKTVSPPLTVAFPPVPMISIWMGWMCAKVISNLVRWRVINYSSWSKDWKIRETSTGWIHSLC